MTLDRTGMGIDGAGIEHQIDLAFIKCVDDNGSKLKAMGISGAQSVYRFKCCCHKTQNVKFAKGKWKVSWKGFRKEGENLLFGYPFELLSAP